MTQISCLNEYIEEAAKECTHDLVYKCKDRALQGQLEELSACLATQTQAAGMIAEMMYKKASESSYALKEEAQMIETMIESYRAGRIFERSIGLDA